MNKIKTILGIFALLMTIATNHVAAQNRKAVSGAEATGTFRDAGGNVFSISALGKGRLRVAFAGIYEYKSSYGAMANTGETRGTALIEGDTAVFKPADFEQCTITLKFLVGGKLKVTQNGTDAECGFGANVSADGLYKKISGRKPKF